jgi:hypothetical protein
MRTLLIVTSLVAATAASGPLARSAAPEPASPRPTGPTGIVLSQQDPLAAEMQHELDRQREDYARLITRLTQARSESEGFAIQEELRQSQVAFQVALLRIQAAHARRAGRERLAWQFERAIDELITPESSRIRQQGDAAAH